MNCALIFANGDINDGPMVQLALSSVSKPLVIAADGGARVAQYFKQSIDVIVGDMDSLSPPDLDALIAAGVDVLRHPPEKDTTDLELALHLAVERGADWIRIIGGVGDRVDQTLANVHLLALPILTGRDVRMVVGRQEVCLVTPGSYRIDGTAGDTISLLPVGGAAQGIVTKDLYYPLSEESLAFGTTRGISNVMQGDVAHISLRAGMLLMVHTAGRA